MPHTINILESRANYTSSILRSTTKSRILGRILLTFETAETILDRRKICSISKCNNWSLSPRHVTPARSHLQILGWPYLYLCLYHIKRIPSKLGRGHLPVPHCHLSLSHRKIPSPPLSTTTEAESLWSARLESTSAP